MPQWVIGWVINESILRSPGVLTATDIQKSLGITYNSALRLKRRVQIFASEHISNVKDLMTAELKHRFHRIKRLRQKNPENINDNIVKHLKNKPVPQADTVVLYSAKNAGNRGRKRHHGQTSSIYLSDSLGGRQVGTLVNTFGWKGGPALYDSVPNQQAVTLLPLLERYVPKHTPLFTDEGFKWYKPYNRNHRMVNHNLAARRGTGKSRRRWQQNGVHTQVAEGKNGALKTAFRAYRYIRPEYSQLYLNEYSFFDALKYYGVEKISVGTAAAVQTAPQGRKPRSVDGKGGVLILITNTEHTLPITNRPRVLPRPWCAPIDLEHHAGKQNHTRAEAVREFEIL